MSRLRERIPREKFESIFRPVVRKLGTRAVILQINSTAKTAIPRQTKLDQFMPKLELLIYERERAKADEELERLWNIHFENRLEKLDRFYELSDQLNKNLNQDKLPEEEEKRAGIAQTMDEIDALLDESEFSPGDIQAVYRIKAFPEVLEFYLEHKNNH
jgi:hypothetical protein